MFFASSLQRAIKRGMTKEGDLSEELNKLDNYVIRSKQDAVAICDAIGTLLKGSQRTEETYWSPMYALAGLFQNVDPKSSRALPILFRQGIPLLTRVVDDSLENVNDDCADTILFVLKILAMYGTREAAERLVKAATLPLKPSSYMWGFVFSQLNDEHPQRDYIFESLKDKLEPGIIAVALLDAANASAINGTLKHHPFDSPRGHKLLRGWLEARDPEEFSYALSATAALPFMKNPARDQLLAVAMDHADVNVQIESSWAGAKLGRESALKMLARFALDVNHSRTAQSYLRELGREDAIPVEASDPTFLARAEFAGWLAHPNELAVPPDEVTLFDHRILNWPPEYAPKPFWLLRYRLNDKTGLESDSIGCGLVGSMTWCFFSYEMEQRPPEDNYAIHCYWEMQNEELITEVNDGAATEYSSLLQHWTGAPLESPRIRAVAEPSPKLKLANRLVAVAEAKLNNEGGWVVLDGTQSCWYPQADQPAGTNAGTVLAIHVGWKLLGFNGQVNRRDYLLPEAAKRSPQQIKEAFERLLSEVPKATPSRQIKLIGSFSLLSRHFEAYVDALTKLTERTKSEMLVEAYERCFKLAEQVHASVAEDVTSTTSIVSGNFGKYVEALVELGRAGEVMPLVEKFAPIWDHNLGYGQLGTAAFRAGHDEVAEVYFVKLVEGLENYCRSDEMSFLAEIWHRRSKSQEAKDLLIDCMRKIVKLIEESEYPSDRELYANDFRFHRSTYIRLFEGGDLELAKLEIPNNPLPVN